MIYVECGLLLVLITLLALDIWLMRRANKGTEELMKLLKLHRQTSQCQCLMKGNCPAQTGMNFHCHSHVDKGYIDWRLKNLPKDVDPAMFF